MSSTVNDQTITHQRLKNSIKEKKVSTEHQEALKEMSKRFRRDKGDIKKQGDYSIELERYKNKQRLQKESELTEKRFAELRKRTEQFQSELEKRNNDYKRNRDLQVIEMQGQYAQKAIDANDSFNKKQEDTQMVFNNKVFDATLKFDEEFGKTKENFAETLSLKAAENSNKLGDQNKIFQTKLLSDEVQFKGQMFNQKKEHEGIYNNMKREYENKNINLKATSEDKIARDKKFYQQTLVEMQKNFKQKFDQMMKEQDTYIKLIKEKNKNEVENLVRGFAKEKNNISDRAADSFYRVNYLEPKISDKKNHYEVRLAVPQHEAGNVLLSAKDRSLRISMTRNFSEIMRDPAGLKSEAKKHESMTKEFHVNEIVNPNKVVRTYEDGYVIFVVPKK